MHLRNSQAWHQWQRMQSAFVAAIAFALTALTSGCASTAEDLFPDKSKVGLSVGAVGHYGSKIGIPEFSVDGVHMGNNRGWGGGGSGRCCVLVPRTITRPITVTVTWVTYRSNVDEEREHIERVPVHFAIAPGDSSGLYVHFLPGHKVEVWVSRPYPYSAIYPGPPFPDGPPPIYVPLADERPQPENFSPKLSELREDGR